MSRNDNNGGNNNSNQLVPQDMFKLFLDNQSKEIALRGQQLTLDSKKIDSDAKLAEKSIDAQIKHNDNQKEYFTKKLFVDRSLGALCAILLAAFLLTALYLGKDALIQEILKLILAAGGGGGFGYFMGFRKGKTEKPSSSDEDE